MAKTVFKTIDQYHAAFPADVRLRMEQIRKIIRQVAPQAEEVISYQIPAFKYKGFLIYYAAFASHISLSSPWSAALLSQFGKDLKNRKVSKSAIQFPNDEPLPEDLIRRIVEFRKKENEAK